MSNIQNHRPNCPHKSCVGEVDVCFCDCPFKAEHKTNEQKLIECFEWALLENDTEMLRKIYYIIGKRIEMNEIAEQLISGSPTEDL